MGGYRFIIFLSIVIAVYSSVNTYIYFRLKSALAPAAGYLWLYRAVMLSLILAYPVGRIVRSICYCRIENVLIHIGSWWLGAMYYFFLILLIMDVFKLIDHFLKLSYKAGFKNFFASRIPGIAVVVIVACLVLYGFINALNLRINEIKVDKNNPLSRLNMRAVMFSDFHLGILVHEKKLANLVEKVNSLEPDIVFVLGDLLDENAEKLRDLAGMLRTIKSRYGVYGVTGNHEYYVGQKASLEFMKLAGIRVLQNEVITIDDKLNLIGLNDITSQRFGDDPPDLKGLVTEKKEGLPTILLKHQPLDLKTYAQNGIDLILCGHVHGGQIFPNRFLTELIFSIPGKDFKIGDTKVYVSDGAGTWGPPMRIGADPEIVKIELK